MGIKNTNNDRYNTNRRQVLAIKLATLQGSKSEPDEDSRGRRNWHYIYTGTVHKDKVIGIPTKYTTFTAGVGRPRAAIVVTNKEIDTTMICQLSDTDTVTVEVIKDSTKIIATSMYCDREIQIESDLGKMERVLLHANKSGVLIASDTNARSSLWYDRVTNERGRILEEFINSKNCTS